MSVAVARVPTASAGRYFQQLATHWSGIAFGQASLTFDRR